MKSSSPLRPDPTQDLDLSRDVLAGRVNRVITANECLILALTLGLAVGTRIAERCALDRAEDRSK